MPGNDVADKLHNFFEQGNSPPSHQTHVGPGLWPILNSNPWVGTQRPNGMPSSSNSNNSSAQSLDCEREKDRQSSQVSFNTNPHQFGLNPEFDKSHPRGQQLSLNELAHGLQGLQTRSKQAEFLDDGMGSNRHNSMLGSFAPYESQTENAPDYSSGHIRNSERPEVMKPPVNFDFLGQQQLTRSQHMGSPPHTRQNPGFSGMQLLQQQLFYKQLQELQRQQQLRQLDQGTQLLNVHSQQTIAAKQAGNNQSPALLNGVPINDASSFTRSSNFMGGESKTQMNSQLFVVGDVNLSRGSGSPVMHGYSNGLMFPQDQVQSMLSMGIVPQQFNSPLHGMPASSTRGSLNQYSQFRGVPPVCADVMTEAGGTVQSAPFNSFQSDQGIKQQDCISVNTHGYQTKTLFKNVSVQNLNTGVMSADLQQIDALQQNVRPEEYPSRQEQSDWSQNLHEKASAQIAPSHGGTSLDPTEEKILFGTDDDDTWGAFGSWSALVEDAVRGSSEDKGNHEEWNCPGSGKIANHSTVLTDNGKQNAAIENKNRDSTSSLTSKPFPLFNAATSSPISHIAPSFQHSLVKSAYGRDDRVEDAPCESFQQSSKEAKMGQFDQSQMKNQFVETCLQAQMHAHSANYGVLPEYGGMQSVNNVHSSDVESNPGNVQVDWGHHKNSPLSFVRSQHTNRSNGKESMPPSGDTTLKFHDNYNTTQYSQRNETHRAMHVENNYDGSMRSIGGNHEKTGELDSDQHMQTEDSCTGNFAAVKNLDSLEMRKEKNQQVGSRHQVDIRKHVGFDSSLITKDVNGVKHQHQQNMGPQALDSSLNCSDRASRQTSDTRQHAKVPSYEDHTSYQSFRDQHTNNGVKSPSHTSYSQGVSQSVIGGYENKGQGYVGRAVSNDALGMGQERFRDLQRNVKESVEMQSRGIIPSHKSSPSASFVGYTSHFPQNIRTGQTSQNMLELLHKVDRSSEANNLTRISFRDQNLVPGMPETAAIDRSASHPQHNESSSFQGFGLRLAPPSQRQLVPNHVSPPSTSVNDFNAVQVDPDAGKDQTRSPSTSPVHSMPTDHERPQRESWNNRSNGQTHKDSSYSINQDNSLTVSTSNFADKESQFQKQQQISDAPGCQVMDQSTNVSRVCQAEINAHVKHASLHGRALEAHDHSLAEKSIQESLPSVTGRIPLFRLPSSDDNHAPASHFYSPDTNHSQPSSASFNQRKSSGQELPVVETSSAPQVPASSGMSHQAGFSSMFHNVWTSVSAQKRSAGSQPHKLTPNILQSMILSTSGRGTNSWALQKADDQSNKGGSASSCATGPHQFTGREEHWVKDNSSRQIFTEKVDVAHMKSGTSQSQETVPNHIRDGNSSVSISSLGHQHQQEASKRKHGQESSPNYHKEHVSPPTVASSSSNMSLYTNLPKPSDGQLYDYSLFQQMQAMKSADLDPGEKIEKGLKGADSGSDATLKDCDTGQKFIYGQNSLIRFPVDSELPESSHNSFPQDVKMLSFSRENEEAGASTSSQFMGRGLPSQDRYSSKQHSLQHHTQSLDANSISSFMGGKHPQISPQMAPSWFEQYGAYKKGHILDTDDSHRSAHAGSQQDTLPRVSESMDNNIVMDKRTDIDQVGSLWQGTSSPKMVAEESTSLPLDVSNHYIVQRSKKRKSTPPKLLSWYKEITQGSQRLQMTSWAEMDWIQATNRLIEKVEDDSEMIEDGLLVPRSRRRLMLTTQLMQHLLPAGPAAILSAEATSTFDSLTYFVAKTSLADACSMVSFSKNNSHVHQDNGNMMSETLQISENNGCHFSSKAAENFIERSRKLENGLSRLEKRASMLDLRVECQELERFSIINRLAKFHSRSQTDGVETSLTSESAYRRTFPQRYVTAYPMPGNLPEGVHCLSL